MKLRELVVNCIKETVRSEDNDITESALLNGELEINPEYSTMVYNVLLSINKAISRFLTADKIPYKVASLKTDINGKVNVSTLNIKKIKGIIAYGKYSGWSNLSNDVIVIPFANCDIYLLYVPQVKHFKQSDIATYEDDLFTAYGISDEMCDYINYFAKSELYENAEPDRAKRYLNYFEQYLSELKTNQTLPTQRIKKIWQM